jgi:hypothetical protein
MSAIKGSQTAGLGFVQLYDAAGSRARWQVIGYRGLKGGSGGC